MRRKRNFWIYLSILIAISASCRKQTLPEVTTTSVKTWIDDANLIVTSGGTIISDGGGQILSRGVCWSTDKSPTISNDKTSDGTGTGIFISRIEGRFQRLTTYYLRAYATNSSGTSYGNEVSFTTPCNWGLDYIFKTISILSPSNGAVGQETNPTLTWGTSGTYDRFDVYLNTVPDPTTKIAEGVSSSSLTIYGLIGSTTYYWKVLAWESAFPCNKVASSISSFTTGQDIKPVSVSTAAVTTYTDTSAIVGGNITSDGGSPVTERGIYWGTSQNPESTGTKLQIGSGTGSFSTTLSGLNNDATYYVRAYAVNTAGTVYGLQISFNLTSGSPAVTDIDGNIYNTVSIGTQVWMAENLKTIRYNDGTSIPLVTDGGSWVSLSTPGYCWYNNDADSYKDIYGAIYNWYAVNTGKLCPAGWHIPSGEELTILEEFLGGYYIAGGKLKEAGTSHWEYPNTGATNESGFTGLPGGYRGNNGMFYGKGIRSSWWSSSPYAYSGSLDVNSTAFYGGGIGTSKIMGFYVRCLKGL